MGSLTTEAAANFGATERRSIIEPPHIKLLVQVLARNNKLGTDLTPTTAGS